MLFKELIIWVFLDQNVGPGCFKNGKKRQIPATLLPTQFLLKKKFWTPLGKTGKIIQSVVNLQVS